jgi:hypothetical protein
MSRYFCNNAVLGIPVSSDRPSVFALRRASAKPGRILARAG